MGNHWGQYFSITTFGESHGPSLGVVVEGCPSGLELCESDIQPFLDRRKPGLSAHVSARYEPDKVKILSGVYQNRTTGSPIAMLVENKDAQSKSYAHVPDMIRPGHASFTYWKKWGHIDTRGGGRASARETLARVCAGAIAQKLIKLLGIECRAYVRQIGSIRMAAPAQLFRLGDVDRSLVRCPEPETSSRICQLIEDISQEGDSIGGLVEAYIKGLPIGLGEPVFDRFESRLAAAMMSLPASKGFCMGNGFECIEKRGSEFNDELFSQAGKIEFASNHAAGLLGGITNGQDVVFQVAFKPASSIRKPQKTCTMQLEQAILDWPAGFRHDPCVAIRACPVVEAMVSLVCIDFLLAAGMDTIEQFQTRWANV